MERIEKLEREVRKLQNNPAPTIPIYDKTNWPADPIEGQVVIAQIGDSPLPPEQQSDATDASDTTGGGGPVGPGPQPPPPAPVLTADFSATS